MFNLFHLHFNLNKFLVIKKNHYIIKNFKNIIKSIYGLMFYIKYFFHLNSKIKI